MTVTAFLWSFSKSNAQIMHLDQNPHQTVTCFGCVGFSTYWCRFSVPQMRQFWLFTYPPRSKWTSSEKMFFFLPKSLSSVSWSQAYLAKRKLIGWSIGFKSWTNWTLYGVIPRSLCKIRLNDVSEMFSCRERRWIDVGTAAIFLDIRTIFGFSRFGLSMRMPVFSLFSQDNKHMELTVLLF